MTTATAVNLDRIPNDKGTREGRLLQIEHMLMGGKTYAQIEAALSCSKKTIAKVSKDLVRRNGESEETTREILKARMLSTANRALTKLNDGIETEDDLKTLQSIFSSTYDRATDRKDGPGQQNITLQIANMFSLPTASQEAEESVDG